MYYVTKRLEIAGCHRLELDYESKCSSIHGHNGMVADFTRIKEQINGLLDHKNFNDVLPFNPTAENIARHICDMIDVCYRVEVQESEGNTAAYQID